MTQIEIDRSIKDHLEEWAFVISEAHATPVLLLSLVHDEKSGELSGALHMCMPNNSDMEWVKDMLAQAYMLVEKDQKARAERTAENETGSNDR